ncbi:hypothetical protein CRE_10196 [Caenorhabditis remanei]|uniref:Uncharacterized protein n=1 Tax=Caenorhabditis remanei TaxID=31234 RepID=E3M6V1_CAERE|nr:hypothetical protein CRE_10196 [Caenorhabditis remanei]
MMLFNFHRIRHPNRKKETSDLFSFHNSIFIHTSFTIRSANWEEEVEEEVEEERREEGEEILHFSHWHFSIFDGSLVALNLTLIVWKPG